MYAALKRLYYWKGIKKDVLIHCKHCLIGTVYPNIVSFSDNYIYYVFHVGYSLRASMTYGIGACMTITLLLEPVDHAA